MNRIQLIWCGGLAALVILGCRGADQSPSGKTPRPVSTIRLERSLPKTSKKVAGSVGSWKTEQIGFEVAGRVRWVLEPGENIEGRVFDVDGEVVTPGTALSQIDAERYSLAVESAGAQVRVAELQQANVQVTLDSGIPADREAAEAELELAQAEYSRNQQLAAQNAVSQADLDRASAELRTARARISTIDAQEKQTLAQLNSAIATVKQTEQSLKDAERNLLDTTLYSSFRGQVSEVHVVPGSVVAQGSPVLTIQMMDPIKIEIEISAEQSRDIRKRSRLPVEVTMPDGSTQNQDGFVYMVDPSADASTRTFTLTLLMLNRKIELPIPDGYQEENVARTSDVWRMDFDFLPDAPEGTYYIERKSIRRDDEGHFVWKCVNAEVGKEVPSVLEVTKMRIVPGELSIPYLGNWTFQNVTVTEGQDFDPHADLFAGELAPAAGDADQWNGKYLMLDFGGDWMLRPGDLVTVDLSGRVAEPGFYVPMEAIYEESGKRYVFLVSEQDGDSTVRRTEIAVAQESDLAMGSVRQISPLPGQELPEGTQIVVGGVHFLQDGQPVRVVNAN